MVLWVIVFGAAWGNGLYYKSDQTTKKHGRVKWMTEAVEGYAFWDGDCERCTQPGWFLVNTEHVVDGGVEILSYYCHSNSPVPPVDGWVVYEGETPAPQLRHGIGPNLYSTGCFNLAQLMMGPPAARHFAENEVHCAPTAAMGDDVP